jgi:DNA segregation ATPase FtsK/SpoIIIE-like protein
MSKPNRLQSAFISEDEVKKVVGYLATNYGDQAADELALNTAEAGPFTSVDLEDDGGDEGDDDELYEEAREIEHITGT